MSDVYYHPERFGLEIIKEVDYGGIYEFRKLVLWRTVKSGELLLGSDSG